MKRGLLHLAVVLLPFLAGGAIVTLLTGCYSIKQYEGDGSISHPSSFWYPQYVIEFPAIEPSDQTHFVYTFSGAPPEHVSFVLMANVDDSTIRALASNVNTNLRMRLTDDRGEVLFDVSDSLQQHYNDSTKSGWLISSPVLNMIHRPECNNIKLSPGQTYVWEIWLTSNGPVQPFTVQPLARGGGHAAL